MNKKKCCTCDTSGENCRFKKSDRTDEEKTALIKRINRISGQIGGIKTMIDENRYCGDILIQISAAESALHSLGTELMKSHLKTCVTDQVREGNDEIMDEVMELFKRLS